MCHTTSLVSWPWSLLWHIIGIFYIPESPTFYVTLNQNEKAIQSLVTLGRSHEINGVILTKSSEENEGNWKDLFFIKSNLRALLITVVLNILQQLSGLTAVLFFSGYIFLMVSSSLSANTIIIIIGSIQLVGSFISPIFVDWKGRKMLLMASTSSCCVCLALLGFYLLADDILSPLPDGLTWMPLALTVFFLISYEMGVSIIPATLAGELFQSNLRSIGAAIAITSGWLIGFAISASFMHMVSGMGSYLTFWLFGVACSITSIFTRWLVPETKLKSFAEIHAVLSSDTYISRIN